MSHRADSPENTTHLVTIWPILGQRRRRWANIGQTLVRCVVYLLLGYMYSMDTLHVNNRIRSKGLRNTNESLDQYWLNVGLACKMLAIQWANIGKRRLFAVADVCKHAAVNLITNM